MSATLIILSIGVLSLVILMVIVSMFYLQRQFLIEKQEGKTLRSSILHFSFF
jgi:hypothetical protein